MIVPIRLCRGPCGRAKPATAFNDHPGGVRYICKACASEYAQARRDAAKKMPAARYTPGGEKAIAAAKRRELVKQRAERRKNLEQKTHEENGHNHD